MAVEKLNRLSRKNSIGRFKNTDSIIATENGELPSYISPEVTIVPEGEQGENNSMRKLLLSWERQYVGTWTKYITAIIKPADGRELNVRKLDINGGVGNDGLGVVLANFDLPESSEQNGTRVTYEIRVISGIPDRHFNTTTRTNTGTYEYLHQFIYVPEKGPDGKLWLSHNLGAEYTNINSQYFNPAKKDIGYNDDERKRAYGSKIRWSRSDADGHGLINWNDFSFVINDEVANRDDEPNYPPYYYFVENCPFGWHTPRYTEAKILIDKGIPSHWIHFTKTPDSAPSLIKYYYNWLVSDNEYRYNNNTAFNNTQFYTFGPYSSTLDFREGY